MSLFAGYRDPDTRKELIAFVAEQRAMTAQAAERALMELDHVGLAHVYRDMLAAQEKLSTALCDYDPFEIGRA